MDSAEEWARELKKHIDAGQARADREEQRESMYRDLDAERSPVVWESLLVEYDRYCKATNRELKLERPLSVHQTGPHDFMVRPDALDAIVVGHYNPQTNQITIRAGSILERYEPRVLNKGSGDVGLVPVRGGPKSSLESIARETIKEGLVQAGLIRL